MRPSGCVVVDVVSDEKMTVLVPYICAIDAPSPVKSKN